MNHIETLKESGVYSELTEFQKDAFLIMSSNVETGGCLLVTSPPGMGKTQIIKEMAEKTNSLLIDIRLSQKDETDVGLFPVVVNDKNNKPLYVKEVPPHWAVLANEYNDGMVIVVFEELNRARREVQNGALQILMERCIGYDFRFNDNVLFIATSNIDDSYTEVFSDAMKGRLVHIEFAFSYNEWVKNWAKENIHEYVLGWLDNDNMVLQEVPKEDNIAYCSPRSVERLSNMIYLLEDQTPSGVQNFLRRRGSAIIGDTYLKFLTYLKDISSFDASLVLSGKFTAEQVRDTPRADLVKVVNGLSTIFTDGSYYNIKAHENIVRFLKTKDEEGDYLIEADLIVGFLKYFIDSFPFDKLKDLSKLSDDNKIYIKNFGEYLNLLMPPLEDEVKLKIFSGVTGINKGVIKGETNMNHISPNHNKRQTEI